MGKIINFVGIDSKVGVTQIVQSIADCLVNAAPEKKILVLHLDGNDGCDYLSDPGPSIDTIYPSLMADITEFQEVEKILFVNKNVSFLTGSQNNDYSVRYTPESVKFLFDLCRPHYDLILVDGGASVNYNGLAVGAYKYTDENILIAVQNASSFRTYSRRITEVFKRLDKEPTHLIINKFNWATGKTLATQEQLEKSLGFEESFPIRCLAPEVSYQAEFNRKSLYFYKSSRDFKKDIGELVDWLGLLEKTTDEE